MPFLHPKAQKRSESSYPASPPGTLSLLGLNVTDDASIAAAAKAIEIGLFGRLDVLLNKVGLVVQKKSRPARATPRGRSK